LPELPDVEVRRLYLERTSLGRPIKRVAVLDERVLSGITPASLGKGLKGATLLEAKRRGKYILVPTDRGNTLLLHFGMSGELLLNKKGEPEPRWSRVDFYFSDDTCLHYINMRLIGKVALYHTTDESEIPDIAKLGPEPLERNFTYEKFRDIIRSHETTIHQVLMDQGLIAGIGNIYSDEITYQAGVRPDRKVKDLSDDETRRIYKEMKRVLRRAIELDAELDDHADEFLIPHRGRNGECPRGHGKLARKTIGGRSSYFCPACQK
jgi:formamidopyrimidine-DNA glycosylase